MHRMAIRMKSSVRIFIPANHPYHWTVIGSLPDLQAATLDDVKEFYDQYYGANNATLVIAGDINIAEAKEKVQRWFGEIRKGPEVKPLGPMPVKLDQTKSFILKITLPGFLNCGWCFRLLKITTEDTYALTMLSELLSGSRKSPLYKIIVEEKKLASGVTCSQSSDELAGEFEIRVRANAGVDLDSVKAAIEKGLQRFETEGFTDNELQRVKARQETSLYSGIATVLTKPLRWLRTMNLLAILVTVLKPLRLCKPLHAKISFVSIISTLKEKIT